MRDMVPPERRSIRNIPVPANHRRRAAPPLEEEPVVDDRIVDDMDRPSRPPVYGKPSRRNRRPWLTITLVIVAIAAVGGILLSTLFAGATITVYPRSEVVQAPTNVSVKLDPGEGELRYETMTVTRSGTTTAPATGTKEVSRSASGVITVYNAYSAEVQRLIANTRFEAQDGKIYRIRDSVTVPGAKGSGNTLTPGSVSVTVYADSPGEAYNRGETRFTIPGFKGDPRYDKFYAEGSAITGGFVGTEPAVSAADLTKATDALKQGLSQVAQSSLTSQVPAGYIVVPGTLQVTFSDVYQTQGADSTANISQSATITGVIVESNALASYLAKNHVGDYSGEPVAFGDDTALTIAAATTTRPGDASIELALSGSPTLVWQYDPTALKNALVGKSKNEFEAILKQFEPAITRAEAKIVPFWQGSFSQDPEKITIVEGNEQ